MITADEFKSLLKEVESYRNDDYNDRWINLSYKGNEIASIYGEGDLDSINIDERDDCLLVYNETFGMLIDDAEIDSY